MDRADHWNHVYQTKTHTEVSWYNPDTTPSLGLILGLAGGTRGRVIDVGGGQSFLVDRLLDEGFSQVTVLDVSVTALEATQSRLGDRAARVRWVVKDVTEANDLGEFDIWHDRAVLHFLTDITDQQRYVERLKCSLPVNGHFVVGTFAKAGPEKCSGLLVQQYDEQSMCQLLGNEFESVQSFECTHTTPAGKPQPFYFGVFRRC